MKKKTGYEYYTNRHSCFLLQYHIVLVTKYRHPVLTGDVKTAVYERINYVAESRGFNILEGNWITYICLLKRTRRLLRQNLSM